ncbi:hypothetical protein CCH79_00013685 [Gambusia affinis]|uniref:Uncharacterized protein n=1 Tax=Gambusia affinis TaxID=33528 RepID=A0A315WBW5_GAMAF|nr:hypothetical protein CCH79_00013685 [Gambusia affinis]
MELHCLRVTGYARVSCHTATFVTRLRRFCNNTQDCPLLIQLNKPHRQFSHFLIWTNASAAAASPDSLPGPALRVVLVKVGEEKLASASIPAQTGQTRFGTTFNCWAPGTRNAHMAHASISRSSWSYHQCVSSTSLGSVASVLGLTLAQANGALVKKSDFNMAAPINMACRLCALSISNDNCYLAYPGSATIGEVQVFDTVNLRAANMIPAHDSPLAALAFDASGTKLATASEKGTVIRVFSIPEGQKLFEFRRGVKRCVSICSLAFSMEGLYLSASSNTETVHIFKLETQKEKYVPAEEPTTWGGYLGKVLMASTTYLPSQVTEMFTQGRAFATVRLPFCGHKNICALAVRSSHLSRFPRLLGYCDEQGAVGGAGLEDDLNDLRLEEENEQPPLILETD